MHEIIYNMKTAVVLKSKDRDLFGVTIRQETGNGFLSITELQKAYERARWIYGWSEQNIPSLLQSAKMVERIYSILKETNSIKVEFSTFTDMVNNEGITKVLKGLGAWKTTGRGANKMVMANPYIWVGIALEMNPLMYAKVIVFITDSLIFDRIEAGDEFKPMNNAIKKVVQSPDYKKYSIEINKRVFGQHITGMRNLATAGELRKIVKIEQFIASGINIGMIKNDYQILYSINQIEL
jgi:hypothetical protein